MPDGLALLHALGRADRRHRARTEGQISGLSAVVFWVLGFAAILLARVPLTPPLDTISQAIPHYWANAAFLDLLVRGQGLAEAVPNILAAPIHRGTVVAGKMLAFIGVVSLQMLLLFGLGSALFDMPLGDSPLGLVALTLALALASTGMGMALGSLAHTRKQAGAIGMVLGFALYLTSGLTSSSGYLSNPAFQSGGLTYYLAHLTPNAHTFDGYIKLMLNGGGLQDILPNMLALLGFGVVFFLIGVWRFKYE